MQVSYGPPGHKGVTHLVAVGDVGDWPHDDAEQSVMYASIGVMGIGLLLGRSTMLKVGVGGILALMGASWLRSRRKVEITQPK